MDDIIVTVTWTKADIRSKFEGLFYREPTEEEIDRIASHFDRNGYESDCIWRGWDYLNRAIGDAEKEDIQRRYEDAVRRRQEA
jgi:hypothetical protein